MSKIQVPNFVNDVYRDLRDRRLLIPAVALLVGLIAVPALLAKSAPPPTPPPVPPAVESTQVEPAVLAEQVGIRDYRKRLDALKSKNPFKQQFTLPESTGSAVEDVSSSSAVSSSSSSSGAASLGSTSTSTGSTASEPSTVDSGGGEPTGVSEPSSAPAPKTKTKTKLITRRIDVAIGPLGETQKLDHVSELEFLPSADDPVVAFLGTSESGKRAAFLVSDDVVSSDGEGSCADPCQFLTLKVGEQRYLHVQPEGAPEETVYRLKLLRIRDRLVKTK
jgi:hypothetical protein